MHAKLQPGANRITFMLKHSSLKLHLPLHITTNGRDETLVGFYFVSLKFEFNV